VHVSGAARSVDRMHTTTSPAWAEGHARNLLQIPLPRRWAHVQGVAARARGLAPALGDHADLLEASAWLHDVGYPPDIAATGFHPLDGARYLRDVHRAEEMLCRLVAYHSCAHIEADERGLSEPLRAEFAPPPPDALTYCDMTTTPDGEVTDVASRLADIHQSYGLEHLVSRFIMRATPLILDAVDKVHLAQVGLSSEGRRAG
jgi:HD domain